MEEFITKIFMQLPGLILGIVVHESAHGYVAYRFGDPTAKNMGRITLNPIPHIDPLGSIIFPLILAIIPGNTAMFGWAKPVPIDPRYFKDYKKGVFWVSFAGPLSNFILAFLFMIVLAVMSTKVPQDWSLFGPFLHMVTFAVQINIILALFNLLPFPPLDGSKMVSMFLSYEANKKYEQLQQFSLIFFLAFVWSGLFSRIILLPALVVADFILQGMRGLLA